MRVALIILFFIVCFGSFGQSTFDFPYRGATHTYSATVNDEGDPNPVKWYVAVDKAGTRAEYGVDYEFVTPGYNESEEALIGEGVYSIDITWSLGLQDGDLFFVFIEVEDDNTGCLVKMALEVEIKEGNRAPIANTDYYNCFFNTSNNIIYPLDNDSDPDGDELTLRSINARTYGGTAAVDGNMILYTPDAGFIGTDTIYYTICDNGLGNLCDSDTIIIEVEYCNGYTGISGVLINDETGMPLPKVLVSLIPQQGTPGETLMALTDPAGFYSFDGLIPGDYLVQVQDANLNAARGLYPVNSSLFFTDLVACEYLQHNFHYAFYDQPVLAGILWYDLNQNGVQDEWYDANNDGLITENTPDEYGHINTKMWEWIDYNNDGSYEGSENTGELNIGGFGNTESGNILVEGPNSYVDTVIIGIQGVWRTRPEFENPWGTYKITLLNDTYLQASSEIVRNSGLMKVIDPETSEVVRKSVNPSQVITITNGILDYASDMYCGLVGVDVIQVVLTEDNPTAMNNDFAYYCNNPPIATTDYYNSIINAVDKELAVLSNDYDIEGNNITLTEVFQPTSGGTASISDTKIIYSPATDFSGLDTIRYIICDDGIVPLCSEGIVLVMVADGNPPMAVDDNILVFANTDNEFSVAGNDYDEDDNLKINSVQILTQPRFGTIEVDGTTGYITYHPVECYIGDDTFTYQIFDEKGLVSNVAAVNLTIVLSETVDADGDNVSDIIEDLNGNGNPCDDDFDGDGIHDYIDTDDDNDGVLTILEDNGSWGNPTGADTDGDGIPDYQDADDDGDCVLTIDEDTNHNGNYFDDDADMDGIPNFLDSDDDGDDMLSCEELGDLDANGVPDYIEDWNSTAVDDNVVADLNAPLQINITENDTSRMLSNSIEIITYPNNGYLEVNKEIGQITYYPELEFSGVDSFVYRICDYYGFCDTATVYITIDDIIEAVELFTPNNDGVNDYFVIEGLEKHTSNELYIYNRWGNLVYYKKNYANDWSGSANTGILTNDVQQLPVGVYYYWLKVVDTDESGRTSERERNGGVYIER